jgi:exoribonuclease-2
LEKLKTAPVKISATVRDLRSLNWCSIDNDDSEDLDQLSVAVTLPSGETKNLVALADVDSIVNKDSVFEDHTKHNPTPI